MRAVITICYHRFFSRQNKYKQEARKLKGKYHITTDTPEFERLRKIQDEFSEVCFMGMQCKLLMLYSRESSQNPAAGARLGLFDNF